MSDKDKKKPSLLSSIRRSLVRPGSALAVGRDTSYTSRTGTSFHSYQRRHLEQVRKNFEISLRDKSDATAKRGFRVQVPKRMLSYAVLSVCGGTAGIVFVHGSTSSRSISWCRHMIKYLKIIYSTMYCHS